MDQSPKELAEAEQDMSKELGPMPEPHEPPVFGYTSADMRAYALQERAAERELCAKLCEAWMVEVERQSGTEASGWLHQMAQHMRGSGA